MNPQEQLWSGSFGADYIARNRGSAVAASALGFLARCLSRIGRIGSVIELGANIGINLDAMGLLYPLCQQSAVEIHPDACDALSRVHARKVHCRSVLEFQPAEQYDLVLVKGLLIHIAPENLARAYDVIDQCARRYVLIAEYFSPRRVEVAYRGNENALWKADFAGEFLDARPGYTVLDYGFVWRRDAQPQDDVTWALLAKGNG